jgi:hypothetical protein
MLLITNIIGKINQLFNRLIFSGHIVKLPLSGCDCDSQPKTSLCKLQASRVKDQLAADRLQLAEDTT